MMVSNMLFLLFTTAEYRRSARALVPTTPLENPVLATTIALLILLYPPLSSVLRQPLPQQYAILRVPLARARLPIAFESEVLSDCERDSLHR